METLTIAAISFIVVALFVYYSLKPRPLPTIPHNTNLPWIWGDIPLLARIGKETGVITKTGDVMVRKYGPISQLVIGPGNSWTNRWLGFGKILLVLADSQEIHDIAVNRSSEFDRADLTVNLFHATVPTGMVALPTNAMFKHHKRWFGLSMTGPYLARMVPRMTESIMEMIELWTLSSERLRKQGSTERAFSAMDDIRLSAIDVIASITFGTSFNSIRAAIDLLDSDPQLGASIRPPTPALAHALEQLLETIGRNALFPVPSLLTIWTRTFDREWNHARRLLYSFLGTKLDKAREAFESSGQNELRPEARSADNVLDMILEKEKEDHLKGEKALSKSEILDELATYALGGSETTATTIQWLVKVLAQHPEVQRKLHREVVEMLPIPGQRIATYEELSSTERLPYLSAVVYEILRVSGTASAVTRDTQCDTTILGHPVPKGTNVLLAISYTQRYESMAYKGLSEHLDSVRSESSRKSGRKWGYWDDEDCAAFRPERWLTADGVFNPNAGPWMPFSFGFRGCFGQKLAVLELRMFLSMISASFFLDKVPEELDGMKERETVTTHPTQCYVRPIPWSEIHEL